jgi:hypothetical protein
MGSRRSLTKTSLRISGTPAASVESYLGGEPFAEVIPEPGGLLPYAKKHLGPLQFADIEAKVSMDSHSVLHRWIRDAWYGNPERDRVVLDSTDSDGQNPRSLELTKARIREVELPALDSASLDRHHMTLRIAPRGVKEIRNQPIPHSDRIERDFLGRNFSVTIDGIDCSGVVAVDAFKIHSQFPEAGGGKRGTLIFPDIFLHVDVTQADVFQAWFKDFVIHGNNDDDKELDGEIRYLDPMMTEPLAILQIKHMGIYRIALEAPKPTGPRTAKVFLYCERMELFASERSAGDTQEQKPVKL